MSKPTDTFDTEYEIERRIRHERLDEKPMSRPLLFATAALTVAAIAAVMCEEKLNDKAVEQVPVEQTK